MNWLLVFVPLTLALEHVAPHQHLWVFVSAALAILPLAKWMTQATEHLATKTGEGLGGLLNATFGNAAELIIALTALRAGLYDVVKASLAGSIVGNILLVLGAAMLAGGLRHREQSYNAAGARSQATLLLLAATALVLPALYNSLLTNAQPGEKLWHVSVAISVILLVVYALFLVFSLITHKGLFTGSTVHVEEHIKEEAPGWSVPKALVILAAATLGVVWMSEVLVAAIEPAAQEFGLSRLFVGVFVVAILGNAAEHATAISAAMKNRMDLSLSIAIGSSVQVALFVAPVLVLASFWVGPAPMDFIFSTGLIFAVILSVLITAQVAGVGRSDWLKGVQLLAVYLLLGIAFFFAPTT